MHKSVLVPIEKYERLIGKNKDSEGISEEPEVAPSVENLEGEGNKEEDRLPSHRVKHTSAQTEPQVLSSYDPLVSQNSERATSRKEPAVPKRRRQLPPPGLRDWKSLWVKIDGRL